MNVALLAYTQANPALTPEKLIGVSDLAVIWNGQSTFAQNLMEYAGRVCYASTQRMGTAPQFVQARVKEGHEDIIEHAVITLRITESDAPLRWRMINRHSEVTEMADGSWVVSGNARVWLDLFRQGIALEALPVVAPLAPGVYAELADATGIDAATPPSLESMPALDPQMVPRLGPVEDGLMRVTLLGFTQPVLDDLRLLKDHGSATFLFEGISRACTHQLVRHRLASFSQESQRYVELSKGGWQAIVPQAIAVRPEARAIMEQSWQDLQSQYAALRQLGILKEDARFLLPNAAETRIVTTMNFAAWQHFLWLRAVDKAAQWEIRLMGQRVLEMLYAVAPAIFRKQWEVYQRDFVARGVH